MVVTAFVTWSDHIIPLLLEDICRWHMKPKLLLSLDNVTYPFTREFKCIYYVTAQHATDKLTINATALNNFF